MSSPSNHVAVHVGIASQADVRASEPRVVVVSMTDADAPSIADAYPAYRIVRQRDAANDAGVDHVRLPRGASLEHLPGLDPFNPSMVRDAVKLAFAGGAEHVDVVIGRAPEAMPWSTDDPTAFALIRPILERMPAVAVVFPDAGGPAMVSARLTDELPRLQALARNVRVWASTLADNFQVAYVDLPEADDAEMFEALNALANADVALCTWTGTGESVRQHGWRSAAGLVAGLTMSRHLPTDSLLGRRVALTGGRARASNRMRDLGVPPLSRTIPSFAEHAVVSVELDSRGQSGTVRREGTMRSPVGSWTVPMLRTAKLVHNRVASAADLMTFSDATLQSAFLLQAGIQIAIDDFVMQGVLTGADPSEPPTITARPDPRRDAPGLVAELTAYLRPWVRKLNLNLHVRPSGASTNEGS